MLSAFASVGARAFNITILDIEDDEVEGLYRGNRSLEELRRTIARDLQDAERNQQNIVIRPLFNTPLLIQLDDLDAAKAGQHNAPGIHGDSHFGGEDGTEIIRHGSP